MEIYLWMLLEMWKIVLDGRCKSFGSSDGTGVGGCGSQSGSNSKAGFCPWGDFVLDSFKSR